MKQGDTQLNPKLALTVGTKFAADKSLLVAAGTTVVVQAGKRKFARVTVK